MMSPGEGVTTSPMVEIRLERNVTPTAPNLIVSGAPIGLQVIRNSQLWKKLGDERVVAENGLWRLENPVIQPWPTFH